MWSSRIKYLSVMATARLERHGSYHISSLKIDQWGRWGEEGLGWRFIPREGQVRRSYPTCPRAPVQGNKEGCSMARPARTPAWPRSRSDEARGELGVHTGEVGADVHHAGERARGDGAVRRGGGRQQHDGSHGVAAREGERQDEQALRGIPINRSLSHTHHH